MCTLLPATTSPPSPPAMVAFISSTRRDVEKEGEEDVKDVHSLSDDSQDGFYYTHPFMKRLVGWGVEARGELLASCSGAKS